MDLVINYKRLRPLAFGYLLAPCLVFLLTYVRTYLALPSILMLCGAVYISVNHKRCRYNNIIDQDSCILSIKTVIIIISLMLIWALLSGQGGLWYQSEDWDARNAIFRDLITHHWPVEYLSKDTALVYYFGHWLLPAAIAKVFFIFCGLDVAWAIGNTLLLLWTTVGLILTALLLLSFYKVCSTKKVILILTVLIFFSGLDLIGALVRNNLPYIFSPDVLHLEWWMPYIQFSSITTCLFWVFNQSVAAWVATACFIQEGDASNYLLISSLALLCSPFPIVGLAIIMIVRLIYDTFSSIKRHSSGVRSYVFTHVLSRQNTLCLVGWMPIITLFYVSNGAFEGGAHAATTSQGGPSLKDILLLFILDAGIYLALLWKSNKKNPVYYGVLAVLASCPFIRIGAGFDFSMRASIPAIFILMMMCLEYILNHRQGNFSSRGDRVIRSLLVGCLILGAATPALEFYRGFYNVAKKGTIFASCDYTKSFENTDPSINFESSSFENTLFFKYVAS